MPAKALLRYNLAYRAHYRDRRFATPHHTARTCIAAGDDTPRARQPLALPADNR